MSGTGSDAYFEHHGVRGMKWGVRKKRSGPASEDSATATGHRTKAKAEGIHTLSNKDLETFIRRANLEQQFKRLDPSPKQKGINFVKDLLGIAGTVQAATTVTKTATQQVKKALSK